MAVRKTKKGSDLKRWFKEKWVDVRTGKACVGRRVRKEAHLIVDLASVCLRRPLKRQKN